MEFLPMTRQQIIVNQVFLQRTNRISAVWPSKDINAISCNLLSQNNNTEHFLCSDNWGKEREECVWTKQFCTRGQYLMCRLVNDTGRFSLDLQPHSFCGGCSFPFYILWRCCMCSQTADLIQKWGNKSLSDLLQKAASSSQANTLTRWTACSWDAGARLSCLKVIKTLGHSFYLWKKKKKSGSRCFSVLLLQVPVRTNLPETCLHYRWRSNQLGWLYKMYLYLDITTVGFLMGMS